MSVINLFVAARNALSEWRRRNAAYTELMSLDDRSLADIGIHRSQIPALIEGVRDATPAVEAGSTPMSVPALFAAQQTRLAGTHRWFPPF
jgi:uncharacterized protein YjiS (DUF1127 family)